MKKAKKFVKRKLWTPTNRKWDDTNSFEYPNESMNVPLNTSIKRIDLYSNENDVGIEGIKIKYTDGSQSDLFKT